MRINLHWLILPRKFIQKIREGSPNVTDMMRKGAVNLVINTPTSKAALRDGYDIRRAAVDFNIPYITTVQAAKAAADAMVAIKKGKVTIKSIHEYHRELFNR